MKKVLFATSTVLMCLLISCKDRSGGNSQSEKDLANNHAIYKAIETGDLSRIKDFIDKDAVDHGAPGGKEIKGGDSILAMIGSMHSRNNIIFADFNIDVIAEAASGDYLFTLSRLTGITKANPGMGMPPNKKIDSKSVDVVKVKDGKAIEHWSFIDPKDMKDMMEMMPMEKKQN